jgi:hypothetical protein
MHEFFDCYTGNWVDPFNFRIEEGIVKFAEYLCNKKRGDTCGLTLGIDKGFLEIETALK